VYSLAFRIKKAEETLGKKAFTYVSSTPKASNNAGIAINAIMNKPKQHIEDEEVLDT